MLPAAQDLRRRQMRSAATNAGASDPVGGALAGELAALLRSASSSPRGHDCATPAGRDRAARCAGHDRSAGPPRQRRRGGRGARLVLRATTSRSPPAAAAPASPAERSPTAASCSRSRGWTGSGRSTPNSGGWRSRPGSEPRGSTGSRARTGFLFPPDPGASEQSTHRRKHRHQRRRAARLQVRGDRQLGHRARGRPASRRDRQVRRRGPQERVRATTCST